MRWAREAVNEFQKKGGAAKQWHSSEWHGNFPALEGKQPPETWVFEIFNMVMEKILINAKINLAERKKRTPYLRSSIILALACVAFLPPAHADAENATRLLLLCTNQFNGLKVGDDKLKNFRGNYDLPKTGGFTVTSVESKLLGVENLLGLPSHCLVKGTIQPTSPFGFDPKVKWGQGNMVPDINFQVYIPADWNGKLVQVGGGGLSWSADVMGAGLGINAVYADGSLPQGALNRYAVVMSDAGNVDPQNPTQPKKNPFDASFVKGANSVKEIAEQELVKNFGRDSIKKSLDVGLYVVNALTGRLPTDKYFVGFSTGGRQAIKAIATWPDAYDGAVSGAPSVYLTKIAKRSIWNLYGDYSVSPGLKEIPPLAGLVFSGVDWSAPSVTQAFATTVAAAAKSLKEAGTESGANYLPISQVLDAVEPVWNVQASDLKEFLNSPKGPNGKKKKLIIYQGDSDFVVPCTHTAKFVRELDKLSSENTVPAARIKNSVRAFFIQNYTHGFYVSPAEKEKIDSPAPGKNTLLTPSLSWNPLQALDKWTHDDKAAPGGKDSSPILSRNPSGEIPSEDALSSWGCKPGDQFWE